MGAYGHLSASEFKHSSQGPSLDFDARPFDPNGTNSAMGHFGTSIKEQGQSQKRFTGEASTGAGNAADARLSLNTGHGN